MSSLAQALKKRHDQITKHLYVGYAHWDGLMARLEQEQRKSSDCCADEQVWTFLVACGYAVAGEEGVLRLTERLTGSLQESPASPTIWFEVVPTPPRKKEGGTHIDLALGTIAKREGTESGIELEDADSPWVCFCEMKWLSDISPGVSYDIHRNQLARVIENGVCFQRDGHYADGVYVTLVTPKVFRDRRVKSRLYQYKYQDYAADRQHLVDDLNACVLEKRRSPDWAYPKHLAERVQNLSLGWTTYDDLFADLPDSGIYPELTTFWVRHGNYQGRPQSHKET